jgi:hypothetical protein
LFSGENNVDDNDAQENIFNFDVGGGSPHDALLFNAAVRNPQNHTAIVYMKADSVPRGWEVTFEHAWVVLEPLAETTIKAVIINDVGRELPFNAPITTNPAAFELSRERGVCCKLTSNAGGALTHLSFNYQCIDE